jgi:hypothetical protein
VHRPQDHTRDYDRMIKMLQMHQDDLFTLDDFQFAEYVMDDWGWKRQWGTSNSEFVSGQSRTTHADYFES